MTIQNLSQLKKAINAKTPFVIVKHYIHPQYTGQKRVPHVLQTNAFYSIAVDDNPKYDDNGNPLVSELVLRTNLSNCGKGVYMPYGKASDWSFDGELITAYKRWYPYNGWGKKEERLDPIMTIKFVA